MRLEMKKLRSSLKNKIHWLIDYQISRLSSRTWTVIQADFKSKARGWPDTERQ